MEGILLTYEELQLKYDDLFIKELDLSNVKGLKGLYINGCIAIDKQLSELEKGCVLAEEIGHHLTSVGDILDQNNEDKRKQERRARAVGYDIKIGLHGVIEAYEAGCTSIYTMADYLDVTEKFLHDALEYYKSKYGLYTKLDNYIIYFHPSLGIMKLF